jgi:hypothetical protein
MNAVTELLPLLAAWTLALLSPGGLGLRSSPWTPAGLIYLPVLLGVLMGRELYRLRLEPSQYRKLRPLTVLTIPLFLGEAAVIIERFVSIR